MVYLQIIIVVTLCIPLPSNQHFIWPLSMCVLADICNHTWIPECGREKTHGQMKLFIDECDMFEFSCDNQLEYEVLNYSDCFSMPGSCPTVRPCPSNPTCPNHKLHRMGQRNFIVTNSRRMFTPKTTLTVSLPLHMLKGKRRYTPIPKKLQREAKARKDKYTPTKKMTQKKLIRKSTIMETIILKKNIVYRNGKKLMKVVKGTVTKNIKKEYDSDYLE